MARGKVLSDDARKIIVKLYQHESFSAQQLSRLADVQQRTIQRILSHWRETGRVERDVLHSRGRPRILDYADTEYLLGSVDRRCDLFLLELRDELCNACGKEVSDSTVWRALRRVGFTMKRVSINILRVKQQEGKKPIDLKEGSRAHRTRTY
ncbi:Homeodomain-like protein [Fomitiporia mediterranea MF3/22]|uniref:Homeodomain-like protein n=1 Tax=Fomitiporia mediterranea (strain MF3/22) TaxID=694068 RepID=UPI0004408622|nr:Homeodomain-like protein [Fomitiporia mediterranea MF3/22]EJD02060.1 Homeodomain-like protein [Fomitiporia mediterranea MF3/22]